MEFFYRGRRFGPTMMDRYIFTEILVPFIVALFFFTTLFVTMVLKDVIAELLGKGIPLNKILEYLGYLISEQISQTIPIACLFAGIMAAGRLSGDSEITAMRSAGISFPRMYVIFIFFGLITTALVAVINFYLGPINAKAREDFEEWLKTYHSLTLVKPGSFMGGASTDSLSKTGQDIYAENRKADVLLNVQIRKWFSDVDIRTSEKVVIKNTLIPIGDGYINQIVNASSGELLSRINDKGENETFIRLKKGYILDINEDRSGYQMTNFQNGFMDYVIPPPPKKYGRLNVRPDNYMIHELYQVIHNIEHGGNKIDICALTKMCESGSISTTVMSQDGKSEEFNGIIELPGLGEMEMELNRLKFWLLTNRAKIGTPDGPSEEEFSLKAKLLIQLPLFIDKSVETKTRFEVEIQKRLATPVASLLFFFVAFPLGLVVKRSGKGMGFALALLVLVIYYVFLTFGLTKANDGEISPVLGAWLPDIVIAIMGLHIMSKRTEGFAPFRKIFGPVYKVLDIILTPVLKVIFPVKFRNFLRFYIEKIMNFTRNLPGIKKMFET